MSHSGSESLRESTTVALDPSLDLIVFVGGKVVGVTENHIAKCLVLAHDEDVVQLQKGYWWNRWSTLKAFKVTEFGL